MKSVVTFNTKRPIILYDKARVLRLSVIIFFFGGLLNCSGGEEDLKSKGCVWNGNCSSMAPEGAYDCAGNSIVKCVSGKWEHVKLCSSIENSRGYSCTCKGGCGVAKTECSYAFDVCEGQSYETCGANAEAGTANGKWACI